MSLPSPEKEAPVKEAQPTQEPKSNEVIQSELEDIINRTEESTSDLVYQFFDEEGEDLEPSINEIDLESDTPTQRKVEESQEDKSQDDSTIDEVLPESLRIPRRKLSRQKRVPFK